jgi:SAM-dependent methyltransferase
MENLVKDQYTKYTYPKYNENMDIISPVPNQYSSNLFLEQINYYIYNGCKNDFNGYKVLVAGVGLGSDIINMGFLLKKYKNIKLLGIDLSPTAINICKKRIIKYDLNNIELIELSLLDLDPNIHGKFDLIICIGVLHHLENPTDGLNSLKNVLEDNGCMSIMVYGKYGRTGVYQMQDLMKKINNNSVNEDYLNKINNFKNIYKQLPYNNWFKLGEHLISDHNYSDEGIVDLILHCQDTSYTVSELYEFIEKSKLNIIEFSPATRYKYKYNIDEVIYSNNITEKYAINELFFGDLIKHNFYVSKNINTKAHLDNLDNILILVLTSKETLNEILANFKINESNCCLTILSTLKMCFNTYNLNKNNILNIDSTLTYKLDDKYTWISSYNNFINFNIEMNKIIYTILNSIDNKTSTKEIFDIVRKDLNIDINNSELLNMFKPIYEKFEMYDMILLKNNK